MEYKQQLKKDIGHNIRLLRNAKNLSIEVLSEMLDISPAFMGLIERGQRGCSVLNLIKISEVFKVSLDDLVKGINKTEKKFDISCFEQTELLILKDFTEKLTQFEINIIIKFLVLVSKLKG